ncbi:uncharacterized protein [Miscanthus floridulus]|uniref:uncharacterized protein n=1 Tax=Miscanthus floridulus TaxID=154761 RepID=UPI0034589EF6
MVATRSKTTPGPLPRSRPRPTHPRKSSSRPSSGPRVVSGDDRDRPCSASFIHDADVYSAGPGELTARLAPEVASNGDSAWYFFSAVRAKTRDGQRKARTVDSGDGCWHSEVDGRRVRSGWQMVELSLDGADADDVVLCKIYFSPRARASASASAAFGRKRKAAVVDKNPANSARRRHRGRPTEAEEGTPTPNGEEKKDSTHLDGRLILLLVDEE